MALTRDFNDTVAVRRRNDPAFAQALLDETNLINSTGHDSPIVRIEQDFYERWPVATSISRIIASSPIEWSTRIGLFGKWGDGKTSVLNFLEQQQRDVGNIVIKYSPWGVSNESELWTDFGKALMKGLKANGLTITGFESVRHWFKVNGPFAETAIKRAGALAQSTGSAPGAKIGAELVSNLIMSRLGFRRNDVEALALKLEKRRLVVFIDDLDRTDPSVVPKMLLVLRELLDFRQFAFVLAFDREIVSSALKIHNASWSGENFLEKVIDFQITLPAPTQSQIKRLALHQFKTLCPFVPEPAVKDIVNLLPGNPRKLKLLVRTIASARDEVARHEPDELDWGIILLLQLFRIESDTLASRLLDMSLESGKFSWFRWGANEAERAAKEEAETNELFDSTSGLETPRERVDLLVKAWRQRLTIGNPAHVQYQATFALSPHSVTWGEFNEFFASWRASRNPKPIQRFLDGRGTSEHGLLVAVQSEFAETVLQHHAKVLERASHAGTTESHKRLIDEASDTLDLFCMSFCGANPLISLAQEKLQACWDKLFGTALSWAHFVRNDGEPQLRSKERGTLLDMVASVENALVIYDRVIPGTRDDGPFGKDQSEKRELLVKGIRDDCQPRALLEAYEFIKQPKRIASLRSDDENQAARFLLTSPRSVAFDDAHIDETTAMWVSRNGTDSCADDALTFLELLLVSFNYGDRYCTKDERVAFSKAQPNFVIAIWDLCISRQRQFRMLLDMRKTRDAFVEQGIADASLVVPDWLVAA